MPISLDYYDGKNLMQPGDIRISASSIARYITDTRAFWGELMLGEKGFVGSTASVLGTITHAFGEGYIVDGDVDGAQMEDYIDAQSAANPEVDGSIVREHYPIMGPKLINDYLIPHPPTFVEEFLMDELIKPTAEHGSIYVGGSCDNCTVPGVEYDANTTSLDIDAQDAIVVDYKTTSATSLPDRIPYAYRLQALVYAYLYSKRGIQVNRIRIVYVTRNIVGRVSPKTGKPLKQYPTQVKVLTETITEQDYHYIEGVMAIIARSIRVWQTDSSMRSVICQDSRVS